MEMEIGMILVFSEEEREYMEGLRPTKDCPDEIRESIEKKLALLNREADRRRKRYADILGL